MPRTLSCAPSLGQTRPMMLPRYQRASTQWPAAVLWRWALALAVALLSMALVAPRFARADGEPGTRKYAATVKLRGQSMKALDALWKQDPVGATTLGMHRYDGALASWSPTARAARLAELSRWEAALRATDVSVINPRDRVDQAVLVSTMAREKLELTTLKRWQRDPGLYADECVQGVYSLLTRPGITRAESATNITRRLEQVPRVMAELRANVTQPPRLLAESGASSLERGAAFIEHALDDTKDDVPAASRARWESARSGAIAAMRATAKEMRARGVEDGSIALGRAATDEWLRTAYAWTASSDSLLGACERSLDATTAAWAAAGGGSGGALHIVAAGFASGGGNGGDPVRTARGAIDDARQFVSSHGVVTVPASLGPLVATATPYAFRGVSSACALEPPAPFEQPFPGDHTMPAERRRELTTGLLYVSDNHDGAYAAAGVSLDGWDQSTAFVGAYLPIALANQNIDMVRKAERNDAALGGWMLYASELLTREQYFRGDDARRQVEAARRRAFASAVADVHLARGDWNARDARAYLQKRGGVDGDDATAIVVACAHTPGRAAAAAIGYYELLAARDAYARNGGSMRGAGFHDAMMAEGLVPPALAARVVCAAASR